MFAMHKVVFLTFLKGQDRDLIDSVFSYTTLSFSGHCTKTWKLSLAWSF